MRRGGGVGLGLALGFECALEAGFVGATKLLVADVCVGHLLVERGAPACSETSASGRGVGTAASAWMSAGAGAAASGGNGVTGSVLTPLGSGTAATRAGDVPLGLALARVDLAGQVRLDLARRTPLLELIDVAERLRGGLLDLLFDCGDERGAIEGLGLHLIHRVDLPGGRAAVGLGPGIDGCGFLGLLGLGVRGGVSLQLARRMVHSTDDGLKRGVGVRRCRMHDYRLFAGLALGAGFGLLPDGGRVRRPGRLFLRAFLASAGPLVWSLPGAVAAWTEGFFDSAGGWAAVALSSLCSCAGGLVSVFAVGSAGVGESLGGGSTLGGACGGRACTLAAGAGGARAGAAGRGLMMGG